jgi:hypothetical protein
MELQTVSNKEYDIISTYAQFVSDNMILILKKVLEDYKNIVILDNDITLFTSNKNCDIEYNQNTFCLANHINFETIISKFKQYRNLQAYTPKSQDPICIEFNSRNKKYNKINEHILSKYIDIIDNNNSNVSYIIISLSLWCDYDINEFKNDNSWVFQQNHANLLIINASNRECTILDPHGPLNHCKKTKSIIREFNKSISSKYFIKFVDNKTFTIFGKSCYIKHNIQQSDFLCVTWVIYMIYEILNNNTNCLNHKYNSIANMIKLLISTCDQMKHKIQQYTHSKIYDKNLRFVPKRYIRIYKSLFSKRP